MRHSADLSATDLGEARPPRRRWSLSALLKRRRRPVPAPVVPSESAPPPTAALIDRISLTVIAGHPDRAQLAEQLRPAYRDWQAQNWTALGQRITRLDRHHTTLPSGDRLAPALGQALFRHIAGAQVCQMIDRGQPVTTGDLADTLFQPLERALTKPDTAPAVHLLAAQMQLDIGGARRGDAAMNLPGEDTMTAADARFQQARQILNGIAPRATGSALFAELEYRTRAAQGCDETDLTQAALDWSRTAPTSLTPFAVHGLHLLPQWFGGDHSLAAFADRVWSDTHETLGAAGYAACYLSAIEADPNVLLTLDTGAFRDGLIAMMQEADDPDVVCNAILRTLWEVSTEGYGIDGRDTPALRRMRRDLRAIFAYLAHHTLGPVLPDVWGRGWTQTRLLHALSDAFAGELAEGRRIAIGLDGAVVSDAA